MKAYKIGFQALNKEKYVLKRLFNDSRLKKFHERKHFKVKTRILILIKG